MSDAIKFSKFTLVGLFSLLIDNVVILLATKLGIAYIVSRSFSFLVTLVFSYLFNCILVFKHDLKRQTFVRFFVAVGLSALLSYGCSLVVFYFILSDYNPLIATNIVAIIFATVNYSVQKKWVFIYGQNSKTIDL